MKFRARNALAPAGLVFGALLAANCRTPPDGEAYVQGLATAQCQWARSCCELTEIEALLKLDPTDSYSVDVARGALTNQQSCEDLVHSAFTTNNRGLLNSIDVKRVTLDKDALAKCTSAYAAASTACDVGAGTGAAIADVCDLTKIFTGTVKANGPCFQALDCVTGTTCWQPGGPLEAGICRPTVKENGACRRNDMCSASDVCVLDDTRESVCAVPETQAVQEFCTSDALCAAGSFCDITAELCKAKGGDQAVCNLDKHCLSNRCNTDLGKCDAQAEENGPCSSALECTTGLWCDSSKAASFCAIPLRTGKPGDVCSSSAPCGDGLACVGGTCKAPLSDGEACTVASQCSAASYCDALRQVCSPRKAVGVACLSTLECTSDGYCIAGACTPRIELGKACVSSVSCVNTARCDVTTGLCIARLGVGDICTGPTDCSNDGAGHPLICESFAGRCAPRLTAAAQCDVSDACPDSQYCSPTGGGSVCEVAPTAALGQSCGVIACQTGLYCGAGTCKKVGAEGETCNSTAPCGTGLFCNSTIAGTCAAKHAAGDTCNLTSDCTDGLYCNTYTAACTAYAATGDTCSTSLASTTPLCQPGLKCTYALVGSVGSYTCTEGGASGATCVRTTDCATGLFCSAGTCLAKITEGGSCLSASAVCADGLKCNGVICTEGKSAGQSCAITAECATSYACRRYFGTCTDRSAAGAQCTAAPQCESSLECTEKRACKARAKKGEKCDEAMPCAQGLRCDPEWGTCIATGTALGYGGHCQVNEQCLSGACVDGVCSGACQGIPVQPVWH